MSFARMHTLWQGCLVFYLNKSCERLRVNTKGERMPLFSYHVDCVSITFRYGQQKRRAHAITQPWKARKYVHHTVCLSHGRQRILYMKPYTEPWKARKYRKQDVLSRRTTFGTIVFQPWMARKWRMLKNGMLLSWKTKRQPIQTACTLATDGKERV